MINAAAVLALLGELYLQVTTLQAENTQLRALLAASPDPHTDQPVTSTSGGGDDDA